MSDDAIRRLGKRSAGLILMFGLAIALVVAIGLAVRAGDDRGADEASYELNGETYSIDCEDRALFLEQWMGPGLLDGEGVFDAWASECGWTGSGPWLTEAP
jgi:hypothetical protein